jgi:hypothetical protein
MFGAVTTRKGGPVQQMPCENGLYCVQTRDGDEKCSTCDQHKLTWYTDSVDKYCKPFNDGWTPEAKSDHKRFVHSANNLFVHLRPAMNRRAITRRPARGLSAGFSRRRKGSPTMNGRAKESSQSVLQCHNVVWSDLVKNTRKH